MAVVVKQPAMALPAALASHFAIDAIPHWNYKTPDGLFVKRIAMITDLVLSILVTAFLVATIDIHVWIIILAAFLAILPDAMWLPAMLYDKPTKPDPSLLGKLRAFHEKIQWSETTPGAIVEVVWFVSVAWLVLRLGT